MSLDLHCVICGEFIPDDRARRGAVTCNPEHGKEVGRRKRAEKANKACRLCGRRIRKSRTAPSVTQDVETGSSACAESAQGNV